MTQIIYPAGGWLPPGAPVNWQRSDQGRDFVTTWQGIIQGPGDGVCVNVGSNVPFPDGFGPDYPWVKITTGQFAGHTFYIGHCSTLVHTGQAFKFGDPLARADQGHNFEGTLGGWVELGEIPFGPVVPSHWFDGILMKPLVVNVPNPDPHNYLWFDTAVPMNGRTYNERLLVETYDKLRVHGLLNRKKLAPIRLALGELAKRIDGIAHSSAELMVFHRKFRRDQMLGRSQGKRYV